MSIEEVLVITQESSWRDEEELLHESAPEILRFAQNDKIPGCRVPRSRIKSRSVILSEAKNLARTSGQSSEEVMKGKGLGGAQRIALPANLVLTFQVYS